MVALIRFLLLALVSVHAATAQDRRAAEVQIKAAFLYKFGDFVQWPPAAFARPDSPFVIGVLGAEDVAAALDGLVADRTLQGRPIAVRRLRRGDGPAGLHVLFIGQAESARMAETLALARGHPLLIVTESENALAAGSMINFVPEENRVRFDVALAAAEREQLKISARLLSVARRVITL